MVKKLKIKSPAVVRPMPQEATTRGSTRSESVPAKGESRAIITGWDSRIRPAVWESKPAATCR